MSRKLLRNENLSFLAKLVGFMIFILLLGVSIVNSYPELARVNRFIGIVTIIISIPLILRSFSLPREAVLYGAFILWAILSGLIVSQSITLFWDIGSLLVQLFSLWIIVINLGRIFKDATVNFWILIGVSVVSLMNVLINGQYSDVFLGEAYDRASSFMANPNDFGALLYLGSIATLFLLGKAKGFQRFFLVGLLFLFSVGIVYSGSRKGFFTLIVLIVFWLFFCFRKYFIKRPVIIILVAAVMIGTWYFTNYVINNTYLGVRIIRVWENPAATYTRINLYQEAFDVFKSHPIAGVGLNNFRLYSSSSKYAHSDYAEILADTGLLGALLYFSIYWVLWFRLSRLERNVTQPEQAYSLGVFKAAILSVLVIGLGQPNFYSIFKIFLLATIIGYAIALEKKLAAENTISLRQVILPKDHSGIVLPHETPQAVGKDGG